MPNVFQGKERLFLAMHSYYHCVPGRMRVRMPALKHQPGRGAEVERLLRGIAGVSAVTFTPLTGSVVVLFDPDRIGPDQISGCLKDGGLLDPSLVISADEHIQGAVTQAGLRIGKVAVGWALGKTLEANGLSLLAALI
jgi:copper chaperone CopZ